jgi:hypothetical protein
MKTKNQNRKINEDRQLGCIEKLLRQGTRLQPDNHHLWSALAGVLESRGKFNEAAKAQQQSLELMDEPVEDSDWDDLFSNASAGLVDIAKLFGSRAAGVQSFTDQRAVFMYGLDGQPAVLAFMALDDAATGELTDIFSSLTEQSIDHKFLSPLETGHKSMLYVRLTTATNLTSQQLTEIDANLATQAWQIAHGHLPDHGNMIAPDRGTNDDLGQLFQAN